MFSVCLTTLQWENPRAPELHCSVFFSDSYWCAQYLQILPLPPAEFHMHIYSDSDRVLSFILMRGAAETPPKALAIIRNCF